LLTDIATGYEAAAYLKEQHKTHPHVIRNKKWLFSVLRLT